MPTWTSLAVLSALAVSTLSLPGPDGAYNIPNVGTGRRSQYYVLHSDGTYKYGHDTGEGAFESARSSRVGQQRGAFGYRDPDGNSVRLNYKAGEEGFVPTGNHLPQPHPDFYAAHAEAQARPPFFDPLADSNTDASYNFDFAAEGQARREHSDSDGNVRGSYTYTDDDGNTRTYQYTAGRGTGFVIEGNDLPQAPQALGATPAGTRHSATSHSSVLRASGTASSPGASSSSNLYRAPSAAASSATFRGSASSHPASAPSSGSSFTPSTRSRPFEPANVRSSLSPDGSYEFQYQTSSHSRAESGDSDNNVDGNFAFVADDDGQRRSIQYEAGADTGFIAEGNHIPVGPIVPGAPSGQPTGRIVPVREIPFFDPLADSNADASYDFAFDSEQYSRSETADSDGNVRGTYTIVDDDGTRRTYNFRAGEGVGFETAEVSRSRGAPPSRPSGGSSPFRAAASSGHRSAVSSTYSAPSAAAAAAASSSSSTRHTSRQSSASGYSSSSTFSGDHSNFKLHQYEASSNPNKFGYVLTFDN